MWKHVCGGVLLAVLSGVIPMALTETTASAGCLFHYGCSRCKHPVGTCNCQTPQPVIEMQMVPQQTTVLRNEVVTQYRQEAVTQNVPVTTYRNVVVDEGGYQMVYVPKPVMKQVPQVTCQQQLAYRTVPYQVTRQVPQVITQMVPQQIVRTPPCLTCPTLPFAPIAAPCGPCGGAASGTAPIYSSGPTIGQPYPPAPSIAPPAISNPVMMLAPTPAHSGVESHANPVPDPKFLDSPGAARNSWTTIGTRHGGRSDSSSDEVSRTSSTNGIRFKPARTVYRSWETQSRTAASDAPSRQ